MIGDILNAKSVAVVGVSQNPMKIGSVIFQTLQKKFKGKVFPVTPKHQQLYGRECYPNLIQLVKDKKKGLDIDLVVIAVPTNLALKVLEEMGKLKLHSCILVTAGFKEINNTKAENQLNKLLNKYKINVVGPNCLGILNTDNNLDTLFLPPERLQRPRKGNIAFISQSGAVGSAVIDYAASQNMGFSKFISYGNANNIDESDLLNYLNKDKDTQVICMYLEGVKDGKKFLETARKIKKPIIAIKGGLHESSQKATLSHTGTLAGSGKVYEGVFKQAKILQAHSLEEVFDYAKMFSFIKNKPKGRRIQIITNGGGYGIVAADAVGTFELEMAELGKIYVKSLKKKFSPLATVDNPMDLVGDATNERYKLAVEAAIKDKNNDMVLVIILSQTPLIDLNLVPIIEKLKNKSKKPVITVSTGGAYSHELKELLERAGLPCYDFPTNAVRAMKELVDYAFGE
jgi:acetate---CoA ligase (ADP-forming)